MSSADSRPRTSGPSLRLGRRAFVAGAGGVAAALSLPSQPAAGPSEIGAGPAVTPNPIKPRIVPSGLRVELLDFALPPATSTTAPLALLNHMFHAGDGSGRLFVNDARGKIWVIAPDRTIRLFLDLAALRGSALISGGQRGLRSFAFHPNFAKPGKPGFRRFYTASTETSDSRPAGVRVLSGSYPIAHHNVIAEWTVDAGTLSVVAPGSRREVLRTTQYRPDHCLDQLLFNPRARAGSADFGALYVGVGDGGNSPNNTDPYNQAQNTLSPLGKILRIVPLKQSDGGAYGIPADNPFRNRAGYLPEIYALGLRHPQNLCFDTGGTGAFIIADIGQGQIEEVNLGRPGANYGWPIREGTFVTDRFDDETLYRKPEPDRSGFTDPVAQYDHDEGNPRGVSAITGGFVYRGRAVPQLRGQYLLGDLVVGRVFHVPVAQLRQGRLAQLQELTLLRGGRPVSLLRLLGKPRADLRFGQGGDGEVYLLTKQDGIIRKLAAPAGSG